jgi:polysaccharide pyruvyl transferase WcaK-like protein
MSVVAGRSQSSSKSSPQGEGTSASAADPQSMDLAFEGFPRESVRAVGVFGHYGNKNLGDEAIIQAVLDNLSARMPNAKLSCFSINPEDSASRYQVPAYPIRRPAMVATEAAAATSRVQHQPGTSADSGVQREPSHPAPGLRQRVARIPLLGPALKAVVRLKDLALDGWREVQFLRLSHRRLKDLDVLMISGSNQFLDNFGGPWGFPVTLLKWAALARMANVKVYFVSIGAGPLEQPLSHRFVRLALRFNDYVSLRDAASAQMIRDIGGPKALHVCPDLAHSLSIAGIAPAAFPSGVVVNSKPVVGINPMPLYDPRYWCEKDDGKYQRYLDKMVDFSLRLRAEGYPLFFFSTQEKDNNVIFDILRSMSKATGEDMPFEEHALPSSTVAELIANIKAADVTVATRFHGTVLSLHAGKPMLGVCYYRKAEELMAEYGQRDYAVELDTFEVDDLWRRFESLMLNREQETACIEQKNAEYALAIQAQYDHLFTFGS